MGLSFNYNAVWPDSCILLNTSFILYPSQSPRIRRIGILYPSQNAPVSVARVSRKRHSTSCKRHKFTVKTL